ncbi:fumarylacetoacetate hydrolase family protein [Paraburkholderia tropica]|uniref:2-keto-4-pentenoate hydratase/2-oxohepta-3-ene-1,7-dioic acid hydratase (Catechol pathway) n=1 Tax=Paraburkholderia tropica TaxID=92647 RepID=A0AAQ1GNS8_9BURK|nr:MULTISPECIES: fumarylacetoacetate hydrolase family protein [Paraburkholderia]MDE1138510.1 fumarylacetoacetate hydrolase family protein [Paraburkholderia tropica]PXX06449.1 2-keto-4-pentenoate hydratase/2-oxohepta-3-ene-1,7-dioic acid hydratase in catechol pathway [Paraburkholderia tropica]PZW72183.1 2-keto-4-pentenoate hydratase/2-oxohepta-3-ene-1,7-dioic acid hydratase in catechol pathway [Paraburkholderia tropica]QNB13290.1 fumarylacetoacetate hydrolase family protein [Paraburkholderia tro
MDKSRRNWLKAGATITATATGVFSGRIFAAQEQQAGTKIESIPPLTGQPGVRLVTYSVGAQPSIGVVLDDGRLLDLKAEAHARHLKLAFDPSSMLSLIKVGDPALQQVRTLSEHPRSTLLSLETVRLLSPIPRPDRNIYCVGWNYLDHFEEGQAVRTDNKTSTLPAHPVFFTKGTHTMNGPFDPIPYDAANSTSTDWEAELAVIIGRTGINISEADAMNYVFGYSAFNDTTERDIQQKRHGGQWFKGKSLDGHGPMGPWIVTAAGVKLDDVRVICRVNGVEKQNASYQQMYFKIPRIIAELSRGMTLEAGDIIATGTPSGVGFARQPPEFLKPGDIMETDIVGVGVIRNEIKPV